MLSDLAGQCADALLALINARPQSPRRDEIVAVVQTALSKAADLARDQQQMDRAGVVTWPAPSGGSTTFVMTGDATNWTVVSMPVELTEL